MAANIWIHDNIFRIVALFWTLSSGCSSTSEYCSGDVFEAACAADEVIVMDRALYGRMKIGRCVDRDRGHLGCHNNALQALDGLCSGKQSCQFVVSKKLWREGDETCENYLSGYAELEYTCHKVLAIDTKYCHGEDLILGSDMAKLSSANLRKVCGSNNRLHVAVQAGQHINITLLNFGPQTLQSLGTIRDRTSNNLAELSTQTRHEHVMTTIGNKIEINFHRLQRDGDNFILKFQLLGCRDMSPPDGAWMTRDGDVIEVGCHAGTKSWTLKCDNNQWTGVLGYCGTEETQANPTKKVSAPAGIWNVSLNVVVFGISSLVILLSACVFLAGVAILKRKLSRAPDHPLEQHTLSLLPRPTCDWSNDTASQAPQFHVNTVNGNTLTHADYKSLKAANINAKKQQLTDTKTNSSAVIPDYTQYINSTQSDKSGESVKYYVLEDANHELLTA